MSETIRVGFPLFQGATLVDFAGATQVFASAEGYEVVWLGPTLDPITTTETVQVLPHATFADAGRIDVLFMPGGGADGVSAAMEDPRYIDFIRKVAPTARLLGSVCSGAFIIASAGELAGCNATTYWSVRHLLATVPDVHVVAGFPRWVIDDAKRRFTGGGISSSIDLALELVTLLSGPDVARATQLEIQYAPAPPFASGDPTQAPPEITEQVRAAQEGFIDAMAKAVEERWGPKELSGRHAASKAIR